LSSIAAWRIGVFAPKGRSYESICCGLPPARDRVAAQNYTLRQRRISVEHKRREQVAVLPLLSAHGANAPVYESPRQADRNLDLLLYLRRQSTEKSIRTNRKPILLMAKSLILLVYWAILVVLEARLVPQGAQKHDQKVLSYRVCTVSRGA